MYVILAEISKIHTIVFTDNSVKLAFPTVL